MLSKASRLKKVGTRVADIVNSSGAQNAQNAEMHQTAQIAQDAQHAFVYSQLLRNSLVSSVLHALVFS